MEFFLPQGINFVIVGVIFSLSLRAWDALKTFMVSEPGFHGLNNDEKCDFSSYSIFQNFHGLAVILIFYSGLLLIFMFNHVILMGINEGLILEF